MKKLTIALVLFIAITGVDAQDQQYQKPASISQFDQVSLQKGTLTIKEMVRFDSFNEAQVKSEIGIITDIISGSKYYALRLSSDYYISKYDSGTAIGVLDAKEIDSAINALAFMIQKSSKIDNSAPYTEVKYKSNGDPEFGYYISGDKVRAWFEINNKKTLYFDVTELQNLKQFFERAKQKIIDLGGKF